MRVRSILLSTAVLLSTAGMSSAIAASTVQKPQGTWAVTKVEAKQPGSAPYCALARRFGNGSIVTFARNSNNETSVAVDFPPKSFTPSKNYTIVLDPGAGETRSYKTQPISERGIVIRMGRDDKFYSALEQTGKLGISVDDKSYAFNMDDLKSGTQDLSACLGTSIEPAAGEAMVTNGNITPPPPVPGRVPSKAEKAVSEVLPDREAPAPGSLAVGTASAETQSLKEENIRLRNALERERRTYEDKMQQATGSSNAAELSEKLQLLQTENAQLKDKLSTAPAKATAKAGTTVAAVPSCPTDTVPDTRFEALKAENTKLKTDLDAAQKQASLPPVATVTGDDKAVVALRAENVQLKADLEQEKQKVAQMEISRRTFVDKTPAVPERGADPLVITLKEQVSKLQDENSALKLAAAGKPAAAATSDDMKAGVASIAKMHTLEEQLTAVTADRERLRLQIASMKTATTGPNSKISSDNWNLETATQRYNEAEREIQRLGSVVEAERAKCIVEKKNIEYMLFDPKIATKQQIAKLMTLENQLAEAKQGMDIAKDKSIQDLTGQLADAKKLADVSVDKVAANDKIVSDLKMQLASATSQSADLQKNLDAAKTQNLAANDKVVTDLKTQLATANNQVAMLQKSVEDTKAQNLAANDRTVVDLKNQLTTANNQVVQLQKGIEDAKAQSLAANDKAINDMKLQLKASNDQVALLQKSVDDANKQKLAQSTAVSDQTALVNSLKQEIASLNGQMANMQAEKTASIANRMASIPPAAGGDVSRVSARPDSVVPAVQIDTAGLSRPAVAVAQTAPAVAPVMAQPTSILPAAVAAVSEPMPVMVPAVVQPVSTTPLMQPLAQPLKVVTPVAAAPVQAIASATASDSKMIGVGDVRTLLSQAGVKLSGDITPVPNAAGQGRVSYRWKSDGLFGTIEQKTMSNPAEYDSMVQAYIEKTKSRCKGQFAAVPGMTNMSGGTRISAYEIACVDDKSGDGASASVAFYSQNGTFTSVAHEASSESMDVAMDARDKIMAAVDNGAKSASR